MGVLNPRGVKITLNDKEFEFLFTLNAIDTLQDEAGMTLQECVQALTEPETVTKMLKIVSMVLINDYIQRTGDTAELVDIKTVGWWVTLENQGDVLVAILKAYGLSMPEADEEDEEEPVDEQDPNVKSDNQGSTSRSSWLSHVLRWGFRKEKH